MCTYYTRHIRIRLLYYYYYYYACRTRVPNNRVKFTVSRTFKTTTRTRARYSSTAAAGQTGMRIRAHNRILYDPDGCCRPSKSLPGVLTRVAAVLHGGGGVKPDQNGNLLPVWSQSGGLSLFTSSVDHRVGGVQVIRVRVQYTRIAYTLYIYV